MTHAEPTTLSLCARVLVGTTARDAKVIIQALPGWSEALRDLLRGLEFCTAEAAMQAISGAQMYMEELHATHVPVPERTSFQAVLVPMMDSNPKRIEGMDTSSSWLNLACHLTHPALSPHRSVLHRSFDSSALDSSTPSIAPPSIAPHLV